MSGFVPIGGGGGGGSSGARGAMIVTGDTTPVTIPDNVAMIFCFGLVLPTTLVLPAFTDGKEIDIFCFDAPGQVITLQAPIGSIVGGGTYALPQQELSGGLPQHWLVAGVNNGGLPAWTVSTEAPLQLALGTRTIVDSMRNVVTATETIAVSQSTRVLLCNFSAPGQSIQLPDPAFFSAGELIIRDIGGNFAANAPNLLPHTDDQINGAGLLALNVDNGTTHVVTDGFNWWTTGLDTP